MLGFHSLLLAAIMAPFVHDAGALGEDGYADSNGVKIHYVTAGKGPLLVLLHGFPDYWYSWRDQIPELAKHYQVVAIDLRGYNLSDKPEGVESYRMDKLVGDVAAVLAHFKQPKAVIVGHDWGGAIAWTFAMMHPEKTDRLIILNLPHPACLQRELANNPAQDKASAYARRFQQPDAAKSMKPEQLVFWVREPDARKKYEEAFKRSSMESMLNYYKANYPRAPYTQAKFPPVKCPVLQIHGMKDEALLPGALNDTWKHVKGEWTLVTIPGAAHFVHRDAPKQVTQAMVSWLANHVEKE
jgi:pimeloyl-ACP methyl ester carboxylesterase